MDESAREVVKPAAAEAAAIERDSREMFALAIHAIEAVDVDVSPTCLRALLVLDEFEPCSVGELAGHLALTQSATSRVTDKLVDGGLIHREAAVGDRRRLTLRSTAKGRRTTARLVERRQDAVARVLHEMAPADRRALSMSLTRFAEAARRLRD